MKVGEWDNLGRARGLLQHQLGELGATECAAHVTVNPENGRLRILLATDIGLFDYGYAPVGANPQGDWILRGSLHRWRAVRGLRLQTDAQIDGSTDSIRSIWRLVADEPRIELAAASDAGGRDVRAVLALARACLEHAG